MAEPSCERCNASLGASDRFCRKCGYVRPLEIPGVPESLDLKLRQALATAERLLGEASDGKLTDEQLQAQLFRAGLVVHGDEAYLLDLGNGGWTRYDGVELHPIRAT